VSGRECDGGALGGEGQAGASRRNERLKRHPVASRLEVRAQDDLALETARLETAVCLGDLIEGDPLGNARPDGAGCQRAEEQSVGPTAYQCW
jgi:hypothetical protein